MKSSWQAETGRVTCRWSEIIQQEKPQSQPHHFPQMEEWIDNWMDEAPTMCSYPLSPIPDFASHSPFGGAFWFDRFWLECH